MFCLSTLSTVTFTYKSHSFTNRKVTLHHALHILKLKTTWNVIQILFQKYCYLMCLHWQGLYWKWKRICGCRREMHFILISNFREGMPAVSFFREGRPGLTNSHWLFAMLPWCCIDTKRGEALLNIWAADSHHESDTLYPLFSFLISTQPSPMCIVLAFFSFAIQECVNHTERYWPQAAGQC